LLGKVLCAYKEVYYLFKLIAIDLDGTLLNDKKEISKENIDYLKFIIDKGYEVVIATGRKYFSAKQFISSIDKHMTILANNGNIARRSENDEVIFTKFLSNIDYHLIIEEGRLRNLTPIVHVDYYEHGYDTLIEENSQMLKQILKPDERMRIVTAENILNADRVLALVYAGKADELDRFFRDINISYPDRFNSHVLRNITMAEAMFEVMNPSGTKWKSLSEYAKSIGINPSEIITIGDDNNDIEMIQFAGLGIAMKNGSELAKKAATIVTEFDNNQSGIYRQLVKILK